MNTDPALPGLCSGAAAKVDRVASELATIAVGLDLAEVSAVWHGEAAETYRQTMRSTVTRLGRTVASLADLSALLRQSAGEARGRLHEEAAARRRAEDARQKAEAERHAQKGG